MRGVQEPPGWPGAGVDGTHSKQIQTILSTLYLLNASNTLEKVPFQLFHLKYFINCSRLISPGIGMDYHLQC